MRRVISIVCCGFAITASVIIGFGATTADDAREHKPAVHGDLFTNSNVPRIQIEIPRAGLTALRNTGWGNGEVRPTVRATVKEGRTVFTNVAIHLKGAAGSFRPVDQNPCLTLNFDKFAPGQNFHGLHKLSLNNSIQDRSLLSEKICRELFEAAGVPVPRAAHAQVELNGRDLGVYVLTEGFSQQFLKRYFKNTKGNLYDGGFVKEITAPLAVNSGDDPKNHSGLKALIEAASEPDPAQRLARLEQVLDMDRFLSFIAMDVMQCDWDGYAMSRNNWRLFHDLGSNRMVFFPHGLDQMFGVERTTPDCPVLPRMQGLVAQAVVGTPEGRRRYLARMSQLYTNVFQVEAILSRVDELAAVIRPVIAASNPQQAREHDQQVRWLKQRIAQRGESLKRQLLIVPIRPKFDTNGAVRLADWKPRVQAGVPNFGPENRNGQLYIAARNGNSIGSWRTRLMLDPGRYRFEGRIRTKDVKPGSADAGSGAGLRISGGAALQEVSSSTEWRNFAYPFKVSEDGAEVEFVCELRAASGEAWFDAASLQVVRLK
jgi:spore coat protein H